MNIWNVKKCFPYTWGITVYHKRTFLPMSGQHALMSFFRLCNNRYIQFIDGGGVAFIEYMVHSDLSDNNDSIGFHTSINEMGAKV